MKNTSLLGLIAWLLLAATAHAQEPPFDHYGYLTKTTNNVYDIISQSRTPDTKTLLNVTTQMCITLTRLVKDDERFYSDLKYLAEQQNETKAYREQLSRRLDLFVANFLDIEEKALLAAGVKEDVAKQIIRTAAVFRKHINIQFDPVQVIDDIDRLRLEVCAAEQQVKQERDREVVMNKVKRWAIGLGGVAVIAVDGVLSAAMPPAAVASVGIGTGVVLHAITGEFDD